MQEHIPVDRCLHSPNYDDRPKEVVIDTLVIHAISLPPDCFGDEFVEQFFTNYLDETAHPYFCTIKRLKVSSHFYIKRCGKTVQFVSTLKRAWHAGESLFDGKSNVNDFSIGVELEGCDSQPFTDEQYVALITLTKLIRSYHSAISLDRIVGHSDIAPGRKTDPGPLFDWDKYLSSLT